MPLARICSCAESQTFPAFRPRVLAVLMSSWGLIEGAWYLHCLTIGTRRAKGRRRRLVILDQGQVTSLFAMPTPIAWTDETTAIGTLQQSFCAGCTLTTFTTASGHASAERLKRRTQPRAQANESLKNGRTRVSRRPTIGYERSPTSGVETQTTWSC